MVDETKIILSEAELNIVMDSSLILTKHRVIQCVYELFNGQVAAIREVFKVIQPGFTVAESMPKISKGENYLKLPFVIMDYPSVFGKHIFSVRTMFWWSNFFSITLHLSGKYKEHYEKKIVSNIPAASNRVFICINDDEWEHHFEPTNYLPAVTVSQERLNEIMQRPFIKVAVKYDLAQWNAMQQLLPGGYLEIFGMIK
ncbi:MAG TPA: hypothetical protein VK498_14900 [Ferruginibacter sp.]|nr:hypothetical protein [Ferruginibacter sp.]